MQRGAWLLRLKEGREAEYLDAHRQVWPDLIKAARAAGIKNHSVYVVGSTVFAYAEAEDLEATMNTLGKAEVTLKWNRFMSEFMDDTEGVALAEVFHFD